MADPGAGPRAGSSRKTVLREHFDRQAALLDEPGALDNWLRRERTTQLQALVPPGQRVLVLGSGDGSLLAALAPSHGVGVDVSPAMIERARARHPTLRFELADCEDWSVPEGTTFDYLVLADLIGYLDDIQGLLERLHPLCTPTSRLVISFHNFLWQPVLAAAERWGLKTPTPVQSWIALHDLLGLLHLADFEPVKAERRVLLPSGLPLLAPLLNGLAHLPGVNHACLQHYVVARALPRQPPEPLSVSVVIPCRNERGNIAAAIDRLPACGSAQEVIFVDGHSTDGTQEEIERVIAAHPDRNIRLLAQEGHGKGDAVRLGFAQAEGDVLMILDADLTVPPEALPRFHAALARGKGELLNGCRLIYPMQEEAMRALNQLGNKFFAMCFTWLLGQRLKDTLCGTKVLRRRDYEVIAENRAYFGDFDPFGDFDLLLGASRANLRIVEIPVRYDSRRYGETKIHRFRHGFILLRMVLYAFRKLKLRV